MKSSIMAAIFACVFILRLGLDGDDGTVMAYSYSALSLPPPRLASTSTPNRMLPVLTAITQAQAPTRTIFDNTATALHDELQAVLAPVMKSVWQRVFRREGKSRVKTLEREPPATKKEEEDPKNLWRVMFHNSEYMPDRVARVLAKIIPTLDRRTAFEICSQARYVGKVPVVVTTSEKEAETYCLALQQQGLTATVEQ